MLEEVRPNGASRRCARRRRSRRQVQARREEEARASIEEARAAARKMRAPLLRKRQRRGRAPSETRRKRASSRRSPHPSRTRLSRRWSPSRCATACAASRASVPVAIPVADDGPTPWHTVAAVAEEDETTSSGTSTAPENATGFRGFRGFPATRSPPSWRVARAPAARRLRHASGDAAARVERHAEVTSAGAGHRGGRARERRADVSKGRSPVVYGTKSFESRQCAREGARGACEAEETERAQGGMRVLFGSEDDAADRSDGDRDDAPDAAGDRSDGPNLTGPSTPRRSVREALRRGTLGARADGDLE